MVKNCENNQNIQILSNLTVEGTYYTSTIILQDSANASPMYITFLIFFEHTRGIK